jgi:hypothetical protein
MTMSKEITNFSGADVIDIRDVIERFEELCEQRDTIKEQVTAQGWVIYQTGKGKGKGFAWNAGKENDTSAEHHVCDHETKAIAFAAQQCGLDVDSGEVEELDKLQSLLEELAGNGGDEEWEGDWYPLTLIADSYFEEYMDQMLEDCGELPKDLPCYLRITVDYAALQMDYTSVEFDGNTYWYR